MRGMAGEIVDSFLRRSISGRAIVLAMLSVSVIVIMLLASILVGVVRSSYAVPDGGDADEFPTAPSMPDPSAVVAELETLAEFG